MNYSTSVFLINNQVRAVKATYEPGGVPSVFKTLDDRIKEDDIIVVPSTTRHELTTCKVVEVDVDVDFDDGRKIDWIVCAVSTQEYKKIIEQEQEAIKAIKSAELRQKRASLREAMFADHMESLKALPIASVDEKEGEKN